MIAVSTAAVTRATETTTAAGMTVVTVATGAIAAVTIAAPRWRWPPWG